MQLWMLIVVMIAIGGGVSLFFYKQYRNHLKTAERLVNMGYQKIHKKQFNAACESFSQAQYLINKYSINNEIFKTNTYLGAAWSYRECNEWHKSLEMYDLSCTSINKILSDPKYKSKRKKYLTTLFIVYTWIMHGCVETENYDKALTYFQEIENLRMNEPPEPELAQIYAGMAKNAQKNKNYIFSDKCCSIGLQICNSIHDSSSSYIKSKIYWVMADNLYKQGKLQNAVAICKTALDECPTDNIHSSKFRDFLQEKISQWNNTFE